MNDVLSSKHVARRRGAPLTDVNVQDSDRERLTEPWRRDRETTTPVRDADTTGIDSRQDTTGIDSLPDNNEEMTGEEATTN